MIAKKINKKLLLVILSVLFIALFAAGLYWFFSQKNDYIALLDGEKIGLNEYKIYLYLQKKRFEALGGEDIWEMDFDGRSAESLAKQHALDNAVYIKVVMKEAKRQGLKLSEYEREESHRLAEEYYHDALQEESPAYSGLGANISLEDWKKTNEEYALYRKLYELITQAYVTDPDDFADYFRQYYESNRLSLTEITAQLIRADANDLSKLNELYLKIPEADKVSESDFESLAKLYPQLNYRASVIIREDTVPGEVAEAAYSLRAGHISPLISTGRDYYLLRIKSVKEPSRRSLEEEQLAAYTLIKKNELFEENYAKWAKSTELIRNQRVWNEL